MTDDGTRLTDDRWRPDPTDLDALRRHYAGSGDERRRPIGLRRVRIGADALDHLVGDIASIARPGPVVVLVDETPMRRRGADLKAGVAETVGARFETRLGTIVAGGRELHADRDALAQADRLIQGAGCVVAVGSGTITDIAKDATLRAGAVPLVVVQTAVSVNAFSDDMAVLLQDGVKRTSPSRWPDILIVDLAILAGTPVEMNRAGFGELSSMFTAPADWYLASAIGMDDSYDQTIVDSFRRGADGLLAGAARVKANDPAMLADLAARMTLTGIAMGVAGRTAPLSGTEHLLSHLMDMVATARGRALALHGAQVGVAAIVAATAWHDTLDGFDPRILRTDGAFPAPAAVERRVRAAFDPLDPSGRMAGECWADVERKLLRWHAQRDAIARFAGSWDRHRDVLRGLVARPAILAGALRAAGAAAAIDDLEPPADPATTRWAVRSLPLMRDRFTVADLRYFTGTWSEPVADTIVAAAGIVGAARVSA